MDGGAETCTARNVSSTTSFKIFNVSEPDKEKFMMTILRVSPRRVKDDSSGILEAVYYKESNKNYGEIPPFYFENLRYDLDAEEDTRFKKLEVKNFDSENHL